MLQVDLAALARQIFSRTVERTSYVLRDVRKKEPVWQDFFKARVSVDYDHDDKPLWTTVRSA